MIGIPSSPVISVGMVSSKSGLAQKAGDASQDFESVLLGQWLQEAEDSFGSVPGAQDESADGSQMKAFAMQHLAQEITKSGGIGIARIVESALTKSAGLSGTAGNATAESGKGLTAAHSDASQLNPRSVSRSSNGK
ncbi:MAG TPA: hypothetical protein VFW30_09365 [Bryocella sp.]|nr:hypothetical protein [Bryocella sp.]